MANYYGKGRTNYVRVTDVTKFEKAAERLGCEVLTTKSEQDETLYGLMDSNDDGGGFSFYDHEADEELDPCKLLAPLLLDGEVMIFQEAGFEKYRYLIGYTFAFNNKGEFTSLGIDDIYAKARELGTSVTQCRY